MHSKAQPNSKPKSKGKYKRKSEGEASLARKKNDATRVHKSKEQRSVVHPKSGSLSKTFKEAFSDCFEESKAHILTSTSKRLGSIVESLSAQSRESEETLREAETNLDAEIQAWTVSILNQVMKYRRKVSHRDGDDLAGDNVEGDGDENGDGDGASPKYIEDSTTVQESMDKLRKTVRFVRGRLSVYAREWNDLVKEIEAAVSDVLGPDVRAATAEIDAEHLKSIHQREEQLLKQDLASLRAEYEKAIDQAAEEALENLTKSEQELDLRQSKVRNDWYKLMEDF